MTETIELRAAISEFPELVTRVEAGEKFVITRRGKAVAMLVPITASSPKRRFGALRGKISVGPEFFDPLPKDEGWD